MIKNKRNKNVLISTAEKNLILNSSISIKDTELKKVLLSFRKSISYNDLDYIKNIDLRVYQIIKGNESREELIEKSSEEWKNEKPIGKKRQPCELCENVKSELKYVIFNTITNKRLEVGSSCIHKFPGMKEKYHGESTITIDKWLKDSPERINRLAKFADRFNGGKDIFEAWKVNYEAFPIEFPNEYDEQFRKIKNGANKIYLDYIKGNILENELYKFQDYINEFNYFYNKCKKFYDENKCDKYICTKEIARFLKKKKLNKTLSIIKDKGCKIPKGLANSIAEIGFIKRFHKEIIMESDKFGMKLVKMDSEFLEFSYKYKTFEVLQFIISPYEFTKLHSGIFYGENILEYTSFFESMMLKNEKNNIYEFLGIIEYWLNNKMNRKLFSFNYDVELHEKQIVELHKKREKMYAEIPVYEIRSEYLKILYLMDEEIYKFLDIKIKGLKWITYKERDKNDIGNITSIFTLGKDD